MKIDDKDQGWQQGYEDGRAKAESLGRPFKTEDFPPGFTHRGTAYDRGYSEGVIYAELNRNLTLTNT